MQVQKPLARTAHNSLRRGDIPQTGHWFGQKRVKSKLTLRCGLPQQSRRGTKPTLPSVWPTAAFELLSPQTKFGNLKKADIWDSDAVFRCANAAKDDGEPKQNPL